MKTKIEEADQKTKKKNQEKKDLETQMDDLKIGITKQKGIVEEKKIENMRIKEENKKSKNTINDLENKIQNTKE